jgi:predicted esterase
MAARLYNASVRAVGSLVAAGCLAATIVAAGRPEAQTLNVDLSTEAQSAKVDKAFRSFWSASNPNDAAERIDVIVKTGISFEDALMHLRQGREYEADVPRGRQFGRHRTANGIEHYYAFVVPDTYDPARPHQVRVQLHGGIGRLRPAPINRIRVDSLAGAVDEISVFPVGWAESMWWSAVQVDNLHRILDRLKRTYNIDENRVYLTGASDGGTGAFFMAFRDTTPWASFLPLIGDMMVLSTPSVRADGEMFPGNAINKPFFIVNGGRDRLYPAHVTQIYANHLQTLGGTVVFRVYPESDHSTAWWPEERATFEEFVHDHPREPLPDKISWQTERTDRYNRAHWLVIDRLGSVAGESHLPDSNVLRRGRELDFGLRINSGVDRGRRAFEVVPGSNAAVLGLRTGDRFVEVNGTPVQTGRDIAEGMQTWDLGKPVTFVVERDGKRAVLEGIFQPAEVDVPPAAIFPRRKPSGRVDLVRSGNVIEASTEGVQAFTLLLSPSIFDFRRPVRVVANGRTAFEGMVEPSVATMLKWAARDNDRTMIFGAELSIELGR